MRHCLTLADFSSTEIREILALASRLKTDLAAGRREPIFAHKVLGLLFQKPSLRTRVSFEALISQHGGSSLYLGHDVGWPDREPARDFFPILTSYLDLLVIRGKSHSQVVEAASFARCPVINGLTDQSHPCQALADLMTVSELSGGLEGVRIAYIGDANNVAWSLAEICALLIVPLTIAAPEGYQFPAAQLTELNRMGAGKLIDQVSDPREAVHGANFLYTDVWTSMGQEAESAARLKAFRDGGYQVNDGLMRLAAPGARFLHCLPARRGEEVSASVIDGPASAILPQAENRLHAQKGLVAWLLQGRQNETFLRLPPTPLL